MSEKMRIRPRLMRGAGRRLPAFIIILLAAACRRNEIPAPLPSDRTAQPAAEAAAREVLAPADSASPASAWVTPELTGIQKYVTQQNGTERAFANEYWDNKAEGIYVSIITGKPLFSSLDKYDSGCGWPSFVKPISDGEIKNLPDHSHGMVRTEVRTADDASHLGHVFEDGPPERGGLRYCINSAALRFIPKDKMAAAGYGHLLKQFERPNPATQSDAGPETKPLPSTH